MVDRDMSLQASRIYSEHWVLNLLHLKIFKFLAIETL